MYEEMAQFMAEAVRAGVLLHTEGFGASTPQDARLRLADGQFTVTDGPFTESKEVIGGFALMTTKTRAEMIEWTRRFLAICGPGECELHQISDVSPMDQFKK
jgi:hypothetical protein